MVLLFKELYSHSAMLSIYVKNHQTKRCVLPHCAFHVLKQWRSLDAFKRPLCWTVELQQGKMCIEKKKLFYYEVAFV